MTRPVRFPLGQVAITANASLRLSTEEVLTALRRHASGDWGDLCPEDTLANDTALHQGGRLFSAYGQGDGPLLDHYRGRPFGDDRATARRLLTARSPPPLHVVSAGDTFGFLSCYHSSPSCPAPPGL